MNLLNKVNKISEKYLMNITVNFILSKRFCFDCMRKFVNENQLDGDCDHVVQLLGICSKCHKPGIVYYLDWRK